MNRLADLIRTLSAEDVLLVKRDLEDGNIARILAERISELDLPQRVCPICNSPLDDNAPYVLYFGSIVRKKARFDGLDCLEMFIDQLRTE